MNSVDRKSGLGYCRHCGYPLRATWVDSEQCERAVCSGCARVQYDNPRILVMCMAHTPERLLVCQRAHEPARGLWSPPAGFVEQGENLEEAAVRETWEEAGVNLDPDALRLGFIASLPHLDQVYIGYRACLREEPRLRPGAESLDVRLCSRAELAAHPLAFGRCMSSYYEAFFGQLAVKQFRIMKMRMLRVGDARGPEGAQFGREPMITYE